MIFFSKKVWNEAKADFKPCTFEIEKGHFKSLSWKVPEGTLAKKKIIDFGNLHIGPSAVDLHIHSRDFNESHKETFESLTAQMLKGGVVGGACMANTLPRLDTVKQIDEFLKRSSKLPVELKPFAAVTKNLEGKEPTDWDALLKRGTVGLSDDGKPILDSTMMKSAMKAAKKFKKFLSLHEEDTRISKASLLHDSDCSIRCGIEGSPAESEISMVRRDLELLKEIGGHLHFGHMSAEGSISLLRKARKAGLSVSAELTPHHGLLCVDDSEGFDWSSKNHFKVCPVIRTKQDREALWKGLQDGSLNCFASDHAPHSAFEKDTTYQSAAHGIISMEYYFSLYNEVRIRSKLKWKTFFDCLSYTPAQLLGLNLGLSVRSPAHFVVFDPEAKQKIQFGLSKSSNSPFQGRSLQGRVHAHFIKGQKVYGD